MAQLKVLRPLSDGPKMDMYRKTCNLGKIFRGIIWVLAVVSIVLLVVLPANSFNLTIKGTDHETKFYEKQYQTSTIETLIGGLPQLLKVMPTNIQDSSKTVEERVAELKEKSASISNGEKIFNTGLNVYLVDENVKKIGGASTDAILLSNATTIKTFAQDIEVNNVVGLNKFLSQVKTAGGSALTALLGSGSETEIANALKLAMPETLLDIAMTTYLVGTYEKTDNFYYSLAIASQFPLFDIEKDVSAPSGSESGDMMSMFTANPMFAYMLMSPYLILLIIALLEILFLIVPTIRLVIYLVSYIFLLCGYKKSLRTNTIGFFIVLIPILVLVLGIVAGMLTFLTTSAVYTACTVSTLTVFGICAVVGALAARILQIIFNHKVRKLNRELQQ